MVESLFIVTAIFALRQRSLHARSCDLRVKDRTGTCTDLVGCSRRWATRSDEPERHHCTHRVGTGGEPSGRRGIPVADVAGAWMLLGFRQVSNDDKRKQQANTYAVAYKMLSLESRKNNSLDEEALQREKESENWHNHHY